METTIVMLRWIHIAAGFTAFFIAPCAMLTRKGGDAHRRWGKIYFWAMAVMAFTAVIVAAYRPNIFLLLIAIFSFYMALTGYRVLFRKRPDKGQKANALDWVAASIMLIVGAALVGLGIFAPQVLRINPIISSVFGVTGIMFGGRDIQKFLLPSVQKNSWFFNHIGGMIGSYIAAVSAFSVVNFDFLPTVLRWLWPTMIGTPGIFIWINYYQKKFSKGADASQVATVRIRAKEERKAPVFAE